MGEIAVKSPHHKGSRAPSPRPRRAATRRNSNTSDNRNQSNHSNNNNDNNNSSDNSKHSNHSNTSNSNTSNNSNKEKAEYEAEAADLSKAVASLEKAWLTLQLVRASATSKTSRSLSESLRDFPWHGL